MTGKHDSVITVRAPIDSTARGHRPHRVGFKLGNQGPLSGVVTTTVSCAARVNTLTLLQIEIC